MPDQPEKPEKPLVPADRNDLLHSLSFALTHDWRRQYRRADNLMAGIVAEHLLAHLEQSNYVIMKRPIQNHIHPYNLPRPYPLTEEPSGPEPEE